MKFIYICSNLPNFPLTVLATWTKLRNNNLFNKFPLNHPCIFKKKRMLSYSICLISLCFFFYMFKKKYHAGFDLAQHCSMKQHFWFI